MPWMVGPWRIPRNKNENAAISNQKVGGNSKVTSYVMSDVYHVSSQTRRHKSNHTQ